MSLPKFIIVQHHIIIFNIIPKKSKKSSSFSKIFLSERAHREFHYQSNKGKRESFIFSAFSFVYPGQKRTLNEIEIPIKMPPHTIEIKIFLCYLIPYKISGVSL
ncbi:hypothetical protein DRJ16_06930 [Candidatus Woesearchaeota archaeon]|nr:MAG: hypothetical protein DRJ16_06930 [Candidatus Woesearchaeota archaeon]